jgi:DNA-binding MarR family transcriptional regulator
MSDELARLLTVDRLVHEPARLVLLLSLHAVTRADFVFLRRQTGLTAGNISSHLTKLEEAGYVASKKTFSGRRRQTILRLTAAGRTALRAYLETVREVLGDLPA